MIDQTTPQQLPTTVPEPGAPRPAKRLLRDEERKMIGGVCAGAADYLGLDANAVRALAVLAAFFSAGAAAVAYVAFWLLLPTE